MIFKSSVMVCLITSILIAAPLHQAVKEVNEQKVRALLQSGSDVNALDSFGKTPLHYAAAIGRYSLVKTLIDQGANPTIKDKAHKTALVYAIEKNRIKVIIYLSDIVNKASQIEEDPLFVAARNGDLDRLSYFLAHRDINSVNQDGKSALHVASEAGQLEIVSFLLKLGASRDLLDYDGRSALNYAKLSGNKALVELLSQP